MKLPTLIFSLALIFTFQFTSVQTQRITGTWSSVSATYDSGSLCCIPNLLQISKTSSQKLLATYNIPAIYSNQRCLRLFGSVTSATIDLTMQGTDLYIGHKYSSMSSAYGSFYFKVISDSQLKVYTDTNSFLTYDRCEFTFSYKSGGSKSNSDPDGWDDLFQCDECMEGAFFVIFGIVSGIVGCLKKIHSCFSGESNTENNTNSSGPVDSGSNVQVAAGDAFAAYNANQQQSVIEGNYFETKEQNKTNSGEETPYVL